MQLIDVLNKLRAIENPTQEVKEAIEQTEAMTIGPRPLDPNSVFARLGNDIQEILNGALDGNDMAEEITDELGDYLRNGDAPEGSHYEKAISIVMDALHDGPEAQADAAYEAISVLHSEEKNPEFAEAEEDVVVDVPVVVEPEMEPAVEPDTQNKDEAVDMAHGQLEFIKYAAQEIEDYLMRGMPLPEWMQNKLSRMHGNIMNLHAYIEGEEGKAGLNESVELDENMYDQPREKLLQMKAEAEAWLKKNPSQGDFEKETHYMAMEQHLKFINDALKKVGESKSQGDAWYKEQRAKEAYEKANPGKRWADLPYGYKEDWRKKTESVETDAEVLEASGEFAQPFYDMLEKYTGADQIPQPWKTIIDQFVMDMDADEVEEFVDRFSREHDLYSMEESASVMEGMSVTTSMDDNGNKSLNVNATGEHAETMAHLLALAGMKPQQEQPVEEEFANSPDGYSNEPQYGDAEEQVIGLAGGLNRPKGQHNKANSGDNAMAVESIKERLWAALQEQKEETAEGRGRGRGKKKTDEDEEVAAEGRGKGKLMAGRGRGKVMAGRGRGAVMAGRGRGAVMAGRGRGKASGRGQG